MGWTGWGSNPSRGKSFFSSSKYPDWLLVLPIYLFSGQWEFFPRVNQPKSEVNHLHLVPELKIRGNVLLLPLYGFIAWMGRLFYFYITVEKCLPNVGIKIVTCRLMVIVLVLLVSLAVFTFTYL